ncbi:DUF2919 family protein [Rosenbergiella australiborealis]|uniref:DUF2919 domain-containing protein n=1 Tax=Rosenbergiella australiborealis TaxID=1544696 RepID=A0ABS5T7I4_9GAMM|nr:DUF2919 family protein [Rosenbergiella australiborealis]MBT0727668.1 DUF2919 domain-containing protein [Rosenbergiella australiborealis]
MTDLHDDDGRYALPFFLWAILLFQARAWLLLVMAGVSQQQGEELLRLFVPESTTLYWGLGLGLPALICLLLSGYRHRYPRCWRASRYCVLLSGALICLWQLSQWNRSALEASPVLLLLTVFDIVTELMLLTNSRLRHCFNQ